MAEKHVHTIALGGDQLTVKRCRGVQNARVNSDNEVDALQGLFPLLAEAKIESDGVSDYTSNILGMGLMPCNFHVASKEGDGPRISRCWKFFCYILRLMVGTRLKNDRSISQSS